MVFFFYLYAVHELLGIFLDTAIIPLNSQVYPWFAAVHTGVMCALCWSLMLNGFVGFQFAEDGTPLSLWVSRVFCHVFRSRKLTIPSDPPPHFPRRFPGDRLHRDRDIQKHCRPLEHKASRAVDCLLHIQRRVHRPIHHLSTRLGHSHPRRPVANWCHPVWRWFLCCWSGTRVRVQRADMQCHQALPRWPLLWLAMYPAGSHDGLQVLRHDYKGGLGVLGRVQAGRMGSQGAITR